LAARRCIKFETWCGHLGCYSIIYVFD